MENKNQSITRIKRLLHNDKNNLPVRINEVLESELFGVLFNYLDVSRDNIKVSLEINAEGVYELNVTASATHIKTFYQV